MDVFEKPPEALVWVDGSWYKIGRHDRVFLYVGVDWISSAKPVEEINAEVKRYGRVLD